MPWASRAASPAGTTRPVAPVLHHDAATWHVAGDDGHAGQGRLAEGAGDALAILGREGEHVGHAEQRGNVGARARGYDVGSVSGDLFRRNGVRAFAVARSDEQEPHVGMGAMDGCGRGEQSSDPF